jgi:ribonuclease HI
LEKNFDVRIYIEQSVKGLKHETGWYGYLIEYDSIKGTQTREDYEEVINVTAHELELLAILEALQRLTKPCNVTIHSSHGFFKNAFMGHWIEKWKESNWKTAKGKDLEHQAIWKAIDKELAKHSVIIGVREHKYQEKLNQEINIRRKKHETG